MELAVHMIHLGPEHWKALRNLLRYLKGEDTKSIVIIKPKVLKYFMFCDSNYSTDKDTINSSSGLVVIIEGKIRMCLSNTQRTVTLIIIE